MTVDIAGTWRLKAWQRYPDDVTTEYPFGESPRGLLIYGPDGSMAVQMVVADRPRLDTEDPIGGDAQQRATAYSTCLAYFGTWEISGEEVVHHVEAALFPNWSNTSQARPLKLRDDELILQVKDHAGRVTSEIIWERRIAGTQH